MEWGKILLDPQSPLTASKIEFENFGNYQVLVGNKTYFLKNLFLSLKISQQWFQMIKHK